MLSRAVSQNGSRQNNLTSVKIIANVDNSIATTLIFNLKAKSQLQGRFRANLKQNTFRFIHQRFAKNISCNQMM